MNPNAKKIEPMSGSGPFHAPVPRQQIQPMQPVAHPRGWLRKIATLGMPGLVIIVAIALMQLFAPPHLKPAYILAMALSQYENTIIAETKEEKAAAEELIAQARADGERQAEIVFQADLKAIEFDYQQKFATVQAQLQNGIAAYQSLYDRANMIQQGALQMENALLQYKQQAIRDTQGGKSFIANAADIGCVFAPEFCEVGNKVRQGMADDLVSAGRRGTGQITRDLLDGMPHPADLQAGAMLPPPVQAR